MPVEIKCCGLTRAEDAAEAARIGARYVGAIFAGGPRRLTAERAATVFREVPTGVSRVGVFGSQTAEEIAETAAVAGLAVAQLHGDPSAAMIARVRERTALTVWGVARVDGDRLPEELEALFETADAVVLDTRVAGVLGGTGRSFAWTAVAERLAAVRGDTPVILAGGLTPENVAGAIDALRPHVVDVSSGVESAPGVKDHTRMRAFAAAVRLAGANR